VEVGIVMMATNAPMDDSEFDSLFDATDDDGVETVATPAPPPPRLSSYHGYARRGDDGAPDVAAVDALLAQRVAAKRARDFRRADELQDEVHMILT